MFWKLQHPFACCRFNLKSRSLLKKLLLSGSTINLHTDSQIRFSIEQVKIKYPQFADTAVI